MRPVARVVYQSGLVEVTTTAPVCVSPPVGASAITAPPAACSPPGSRANRAGG